MRISTLIALAGLCAVPLTAGADNILIDDFAGAAISPDGKYVVSTIQGSVRIIDLINNKSWSYEADEAGQYSYSQGQGNCFSETGVMVGMTSSNFNAAYWKDGEWKDLPVPNRRMMNQAIGITPDGTRICGSVGLTQMGQDDRGLMLAPAVWTLGADGKWGDPVVLPHPDKDFTGRAPQYIQALCISDDGKTIAGQIRDYTGFMCYPIVFRENDKGEWSYDLVGIDLVNPNKVVFPEFPGDAPVEPQIQDYMTDEELEEYNLALSKYLKDLEESGGDPGYPAPEYKDFCSAETLEVYGEDMKEFLGKLAVWEAGMNAFNKAFKDCRDNGVAFEYNNVFISPDGRKYLTSAVQNIPVGNADPNDPSQTVKRYIPYVFDLVENTHQVYLTDLERGVLASSIAADYTIFATNEPDGYAQSYVFDKGENSYVKFQNYIDQKMPTAADWVKLHMLREVSVWNPDDESFDYEERWITGAVHTTPTQSAYISNVYRSWTQEGSDYETYVLTSYTTDVEAIPVEEELTLATTADGLINVSGGTADISVYDLSGRKVATAENATSFRPQLSQGVYIVRATDSNGRKATLKAAF